MSSHQGDEPGAGGPAAPRWPTGPSDPSATEPPAVREEPVSTVPLAPTEQFEMPMDDDEPALESAQPASTEEPSEDAAVPQQPPVEQPPVEQPPVEEPSDEDPFAAWPQAQSGVVVEDEPAEGVSVEHVAGEIDVPGGYTVLEGSPLGRRRSVAVVVSRFNGGLTNRMLARALDTLEDAGVSPEAVTVVPVPGAFELPLAAIALAKTRRYACIVALGAIVRGETPHFDYVASEAASGLQLAGIETGIPVAFGVLTVENVEQGEARIDRAADAVRSALEMADLFARLRASAR